MTAKVINMFDHLQGDRKEAHDAVMRAMERPLLVPDDLKGNPFLSREFVANWFLQGLWMEGFQVVRCQRPDEE